MYLSFLFVRIELDRINTGDPQTAHCHFMPTKRIYLLIKVGDLISFWNYLSYSKWRGKADLLGCLFFS